MHLLGLLYFIVYNVYISLLNSFHRIIFKLPDPSAIKNWTSLVDAQPGFKTRILTALKEEIEGRRQKIVA